MWGFFSGSDDGDVAVVGGADYRTDPPSLNSLDLSSLSTHKSAIATVDSDIFKRPLGSAITYKKDSVCLCVLL